MSSSSGVPASGTPTTGTPSYLQVLRLPRAARLFGFALWGRLSYGTVFLALTLALTQATGSYATTGACIALFGLANASLVLVRTTMIDRLGMRRVLPPMALAYSAILASITVTIATMHTPAASGPPRSTAALLVVLCTAAGACAPPLGPCMRRLWAEMAADPETRRRAFALDAACEEVLYLAGPLLAGLAATWTAPVAGVALSAVLVLIGTLAMVAALPPLAPHNPDTHAGEQRQRNPRWTKLRIDTLDGAVPASLMVGTSLSAFGLLIVAFAQGQHQYAAVSWVEAGMSAGSVCGGLVFGALALHASHRLQMCSLLAVIGVFIAFAGFAGHMTVLIALACLLGLFVSPSITIMYVVADDAALPGRKTSAGGLVNGSYNLGCALGSAAAGLLLGALPLRVCFLIACIPVLVTALLIGVRAGRH
jgi:predicted MFS family arabinose efflux permease